MNAALRFNLTLPGLDPTDMSARYMAALDMAEVADRAGFVAMTVDEHHGAADGWMPSPMLFAGMLAARTKRVAITLQALLLPLHDPLRAAEDLIVLDLVSGGRVSATLGLGYRPSEYEAHGKDWAARGALMDQAVEDLLRAWRQQPVPRAGGEVRVTPAPLSANPPFGIGGSNRVGARRAARFGLPFSPPAKLPELEEYYIEQCAAYGTTPVILSPPAKVALTMVAEDPEKAWPELGPYLLHEATTYAGWQTPDITSSVHSHATTVEELREERIYEILSPEQCRARVENGGPDTAILLHPLCGGMPLDAAWTCLNLFIEEVLGQQ